MQKITHLALAACLSTTVAVVPVALDWSNGLQLKASSALAGNGNGKGGGNGKGNSGGNGKSSSAKGKSASAGNGKSSTSSSSDAVSSALGKFFGLSKGNGKASSTKSAAAKASTNRAAPQLAKVAVPTPRPKVMTSALDVALEAEELDVRTKPNLAAKLGGLNSLRRNYHAYLNSSDPRMTAIRDYALAYAAFEQANGVDAVPTDDPLLSDEALAEALMSASNKPIATVSDIDGSVTVDPEVMAWAKDVLGVGPAVGKIDEIRDSMETEEAATDPTETDPALDPVDDPQTDETAETEEAAPTDEVAEPVGEPVDEEVAAVE